MSKIITILGLSFGDETKGATVDYFVRQLTSALVVRFNGGSQAAHNVVTPDDVRHCFAQFGSGTFTPGCKTFLSREMLLEPRNLLVEEAHLRKCGVTDALARLTISPGATVITPFQKMVGQIKELSRGRNRFGSCGMGIGETVLDRDNLLAVKVSDFSDVPLLRGKLREIAERRLTEARELYRLYPTKAIQERLAYFEETADVEELIQLFLNLASRVTIKDTAIEEALFRGDPIVFEGAQGALLDRRYGFAPYISKTTCTYHNAGTLLSEASRDADAEVEKVGLLRANFHRHGAGPLPTEDRWLETFLADRYNYDHPWQGKFRVGWFDTVLAHYSIVINDGIDYLAINCLDQLTGIHPIKMYTSYLYTGPLDELDGFCEWEPTNKNRAIIHALKKPNGCFRQEQMTEIISRCRPRDFLELPGWNENISTVHSWDDLPTNAKDYVRIIGQLLGVHVGLVSVNPRADGRLMVNP